MTDKLWEDQLDLNGEPYYIYYYDEHYNKIEGISKIDEINLRQIGQDLGIDYIHMNQTSNIDNKLKEIKKNSESLQSDEQKINTYQDVYYYFAIPLLILIIISFILRKRTLL